MKSLITEILLQRCLICMANFLCFSQTLTNSTVDSDSRAGSACTSISNQSNVDDTIQWKKGNVLGKGAFGTVRITIPNP